MDAGSAGVVQVVGVARAAAIAAACNKTTCMVPRNHQLAYSQWHVQLADRTMRFGLRCALSFDNVILEIVHERNYQLLIHSFRSYANAMNVGHEASTMPTKSINPNTS